MYRYPKAFGAQSGTLAARTRSIVKAAGLLDPPASAGGLDGRERAEGAVGAEAAVGGADGAEEEGGSDGGGGGGGEKVEAAASKAEATASGARPRDLMRAVRVLEKAAADPEVGNTAGIVYIGWFFTVCAVKRL